MQRISIIGKFKQMVNKQYDYIFKYMIKVKVVKDLIKIIFFLKVKTISDQDIKGSNIFM